MPASICEWTAVWVKSFRWLWPPHSSSELEAHPHRYSSEQLPKCSCCFYTSWQFCHGSQERDGSLESGRLAFPWGHFLPWGQMLTCCWLCPISTLLWDLSGHTFQPCGFYVRADSSCAHEQLIFEQNLVPKGHCTHPAPTIATIPSSPPQYPLESSTGWLSPFSLIPSSHSFSCMSCHQKFLTAVLHFPLSFGSSGAAYAAVGPEQPCANRSASTQCCARLSTASRSGVGQTAFLSPQDMLPCPVTAFYDSSRSQIALKLLVLRHTW